MIGSQPFAHYSATMYPEWYVFLGRDGWIVGYWLNDPNPANRSDAGPRQHEFMGREWQEIVAHEIAAKGGSVKYSVEPAEEDAPHIVRTMVEFMSESLNSQLTFVEADNRDGKSQDGETDADLTVLMRKAREGNKAWVSDLIERGADLEATDDLGCTALMHAAFAGHLEVVQVLLEAGADPNRESKKGNTALMMAVQSPNNRQEHRAEVARALLSRRADPNISNRKGETALDLCDRRSDQKVIFIIREFGGQLSYELIPWYNRTWFLWMAGTTFAALVFVGMYWVLFKWMSPF